MVVNVGAQRESLYYCSAYQRDNTGTEQQEKATVKGGSVFVGDMKATLSENIFQKKLEAQKKALKTVINQFMQDGKTDDALQKCKDQKSEFEEEASKIQEQMNELLGAQKDLAETYGVTEDSEEAQNLELLRKSMKNPGSLSTKEQEKLSNLGSLTEYQKSALELDAAKEVYQNRLDHLNQGVHSMNEASIGIINEDVKNHAMVEVEKEAAKIMEAAAKETVSQLINEAKEKFDDKVEDAVKKAEDKKEEKAEEEKAEAQKAEAASSSEVSQASDSEINVQLTSTASDMTQVQNDIKSMVANKKILDEDIKGLLVDATV